MAYFTNCSQCGQELDETLSVTLYQEMMADKKLGKWWRANLCIPCNITKSTEMLKLEQQLNQVFGWQCLNWEKFPDELL